MTIKLLLEIINKNQHWSYEDFNAVLPEISMLAAAGNTTACLIEDMAEVINGDEALSAVKPKLTKMIRKAFLNATPLDTVEALIKDSYRLYVDAAGYIATSGILPKNVYTQLFLNRVRLLDHEDNLFAKHLAKLITAMLADKESYSVHDRCPDYRHEHDYMMFITKGSEYPVSMLETSKNNKKKGDNK